MLHVANLDGSTCMGHKVYIPVQVGCPTSSVWWWLRCIACTSYGDER